MNDSTKKEILSDKKVLLSYIAQVYEMGLGEEDGGNDNTEKYCTELLDEYIDDKVKDKTLRVYAEFDNYKKRKNLESKQLKIDTKFQTLNKFIEILDDWVFFEDIISNSPNSDIKTGFGLIDRKVELFLEEMEIKEVPTDILFDEELHEAVTTIDSKKEKGTILNVINKGWMIQDKIIKYPRVIVQK